MSQEQRAVMDAMFRQPPRRPHRAPPVTVLDVLDGARRATFSSVLAIAPLAYVLKKRARRIEARVIAAIFVALLLSVVAPALMLALGPLVFGIPHVAAVVRYLVVRQGFGRGFLVAAAVLCASIAGLRVAAQLSTTPVAFARAEVAVGLLFVVGGVALSSRSGARRWLLTLLPLVAAASALAIVYPQIARLLFVHVHNFGALVLWVVLFRKRRGLPKLALLLLACALVLLASGVTVPVSAHLGALSAFDVDIARVAGWLTPGVAARVAVPLALVHAFSDSMHYTTWLGVIPEEGTRAEGSLSFRMTVRSLFADFGRIGVIAVAVACILFAGFAAWNLAATRAAYFSLAGFHGYLELAAFAFVVASRGRTEQSVVADGERASLVSFGAP